MKVKGVLRKEVKEWLFYHLFKGDVVYQLLSSRLSGCFVPLL